MPQIHPTESYEYVVCLTDKEGVWHHHAQYRIISDVGDAPSGRLDPNISVPLSLGWSPELEVSVRYRLFLSTFESYDEVPVENELLVGGAIPLGDILNLDYIGWLFDTRNDFYFPFEVVIRQTVSLSLWRQRELIDLSITELDRRRQIRIVNQVAAVNQANTDPPLMNYPQTIGNLDEEIIWGISMFAGSRSESWQIEIDAINQPFTIESFSSKVSQALRAQSRPVLERIPVFLRRAYPESSSHPLEVTVTIPEVKPQSEYTIDVTLYDPAGDLYYPTDDPELEHCIRDIHLKLLEYGIPVGPETEVYQRVLSQLLIYRRSCASVKGYIDTSVAEKTEIEGFHKHLLQRLPHQLAIVPVDIVSEPEIGNSRVDLLIEGIPTELKLEDRKTATTKDIVERYQGQAADYIARQGTPFGFLLVLDTVLDREQPTSRVDQDCRVTQVSNVAGDASVVVIAIVVRIPRPASDHPKLARRCA